MNVKEITPERTHWVYTAYDAEGRPLYVGCSKHPVQRRSEHRASSAWFQYATRFTMSGPYPRAVALEKEKERIAALRPYFNAQPEFSQRSIQRTMRHRQLIFTHSPKRIQKILDAEFPLECTSTGRHTLYKQLIAKKAVAA